MCQCVSVCVGTKQELHSVHMCLRSSRQDCKFDFSCALLCQSRWSRFRSVTYVSRASGCQIGEEVKSVMKESIQRYYGVNLDDSYNRAVTDAWDNAQEKVRTSEGWHVTPQKQINKRSKRTG